MAPQCPDAGVPTLAMPFLAGRAAEAVDSSSLRFLAASALKAKKEEEEEEKAKEERKERRVQVIKLRGNLPLAGVEWAAWRHWSGLPPTNFLFVIR